MDKRSHKMNTYHKIDAYKERLEIAKKDYVTTEGNGQCGTRLWWCIAQVGHSYTNMDVENLRYLFPVLTKESVFGKDWAYILGHITQLFIVPTIVLQFFAVAKSR